MTTTGTSTFNPTAHAGETPGVRLHRFTVDEYHRMAEAGVFHEDDPIELLEGYLYIKLDHGPPYEVPLGIPPQEIAGPHVEPFPQRRFTVREYHKLINSGALHPAVRTELIEGWVVEKMTRNARHDSSLQRTLGQLLRCLTPDWRVRVQSAVTVDDAELEPDLAIVPGPDGRFDSEHPKPHEVGLLVEISDSTLAYDRGIKRRDYARNMIARYWIINLIDRVLEVYEDPSGPTESPAYQSTRVYKPGETVPLVCREAALGDVPVEELFGRV